MLLNTNTMIPQVYGKERDIQVLNKLLDMIMTSCKYDIDHIGDVYDAMRCPESLLPLLGKTLNYNYNFSDTVTANRRTISSFTTMEKHRGSERGLLMATALSLTSLDMAKNNNELSPVDDDDDNEDLYIFSEDYVNALRDIKITYDYEEARITINYPNVYTLVRYLLDYVRPVGMWLDLEAISGRTINSDVLLLFANIESNVVKYNPDIDSRVEKSYVNFSSVADNNWLALFEEEDTNSIDFN